MRVTTCKSGMHPSELIVQIDELIHSDEPITFEVIAAIWESALLGEKRLTDDTTYSDSHYKLMYSQTN